MTTILTEDPAKGQEDLTRESEKGRFVPCPHCGRLAWVQRRYTEQRVRCGCGKVYEVREVV